MVPCINPTNQAPGVQTGSASGIKSFLRPIIVKTLNSETIRPIAYIFSMVPCLVVPYVNPANHTYGVKTGTILGIECFHRLINLH